MRQAKLDSCIIKCMFLGYPKGMKRCHLQCLEPRLKVYH